MINNAELLRPLLTFPSPDAYYMIQVIVRGRDAGGHGSSTKEVYYLKHDEDLVEVTVRLAKVADFYGARIYINLNRRGFRRSALNLIAEVAKRAAMGEYEYAMRAFESVSGTSNDDPEKKWIVDVDDPNLVDEITAKVISRGAKLYATVPTVNGYHLITSGFDPRDLGVDYRKDNPTVLYAGTFAA